ncbi:MAG: patatin-like phospholipase family protein [Paludibacteraceae bacterium]|jgi:NTE family protein|nr:patatin-like phospholipase family protein [Paludibacteraceae bacterium]
MKKKYKLGLALSGGGVKGFAHAGALKALEEFGYKPDIISGTSAGAVAGALYVAGYSPKEICDLFKNKSFSNFTNITIPTSGLFSPAKFVDFLKQKITYANIEDLPIPMRIVATDLDAGKIKVFTEGSLAERVMASATVPVVFPPTVIDDVHYVDGGIFCNFPVDVIRQDCEKVIGINVSPLVPTQYKQTIIEIALRSYNFMFRANTKEDGMLCDILVELPDVLQYDMFDLDAIDEIYRMGYHETKLALQKNGPL